MEYIIHSILVILAVLIVYAFMVGVLTLYNEWYAEPKRIKKQRENPKDLTLK